MDQLELLQMELMAVQQQKTNPLSERTIAQIMIKLHQTGFKFYPTSDGNEYVTPDELDAQIIRFVQERGKVTLGIIPQILNLNLQLIQSRISLVCQKSTIIRNNNILISTNHLRGILQSIKQKLQIEGVVNLDEVGLQNEFNMAFVQKIINDNIEELDAEVNGNQLVTKQYRRMKKKRTLGFLLGLSRPISIQTFLKVTQIDDSHPDALIQQLIKEGKLKGKCQNSYFIPDKFSHNQIELVNKFFTNNGYIELDMLHKKFLISKPEDWIAKNLKTKYILFEGVCFTQTKLSSYQNQIQSLMKSEGFIQISSIIAFDLDQKQMQKFLIQYCNITNVVLNEGYCYSQEWIDKVVNEFRDKVIFDLFFKKGQQKGKKKGSKKQKTQITDQQLVQTLFDAGLAEYSVAQDITDSLKPILSSKIQSLKSKCQKQLAQHQGAITQAFLKYRKCKTIIRNEQNLHRIVNMIQKQKKKNNKWKDADFGPNESDPVGQFSLIYYDGIPPKDWPPLEGLKWNQVDPKEIMSRPNNKSFFMKKSLLIDLIENIQFFNKVVKDSKISLPLSQPVVEESQSPLVCRFCVGQNEYKYVLIDTFMPFIGEQLFASTGVCGLIEKAYAKLRYCYKGILNVGIQQLILEITGINAQKITFESNNKEQHKEFINYICSQLDSGSCLLGMGEGIVDKKLKLGGQETDLFCSKPYLILSHSEGKATVIAQDRQERMISFQDLGLLFKNIYILKS